MLEDQAVMMLYFIVYFPMKSSSQGQGAWQVAPTFWIRYWFQTAFLVSKEVSKQVIYIAPKSPKKIRSDFIFVNF